MKRVGKDHETHGRPNIFPTLKTSRKIKKRKEVLGDKKE